MVIAEKQNLQPDSRRRRILGRIHRVLMGPRINRPRPDSIIRSMDLSGLDPESCVDLQNDQRVFESLFQKTLLQSYQDNVRPCRPHRVSGAEELDSSPNASKKVESLSSSHRQTRMNSEPDIHVIPITFIRDKKQLDEKDVSLPTVVSSETDNDGIHTVSSSASDDDECCVPVEVIPDEIDSKHSCVSTNSSSSRRSLPRWRQESKIKTASKKGYENSVCDIIVIDEPNVSKESENHSIKIHRSNKDTLVGGANKVLADMGTNGFVTTENMDIPAGATYLTVKHGALSVPHDVDTLSSVEEEEKRVNAVPNYPVYSILKMKLKKEARQIDYIKGDGNCFFRALSKQLYGSESFHIVIRNLIVDLIATNKSQFSQFVDGGDVQDHVERMSQEQSWATTCEIYAAATLLQRDIFMLTPDHLNETYSWLLFKPVFKQDCQQTNIESHPCYITLCNTNGNHYDRIVGEHGGCNCFLTHPELEGVIYSVDLT